MHQEHNKPGFPGGHIANGSVIVVKDHFVYILHGNYKVQKRFVYSIVFIFYTHVYTNFKNYFPIY